MGEPMLSSDAFELLEKAGDLWKLRIEKEAARLAALRGYAEISDLGICQAVMASGLAVDENQWAAWGVFVE
jgi:hypothetical protein